MGAGGGLSPEKLGGKAIDEIAIVEGVNDPPPGSDDSMPPAEAYASTGSGSAPLSAAALADLRAREARFGNGGGVVDTNLPAVAAVAAVAQTGAALNVTGRPRAFDASEGTKLDPLLNKTYDLYYPKTIPDSALR